MSFRKFNVKFKFVTHNLKLHIRVNKLDAWSKQELILDRKMANNGVCVVNNSC